MYEKEFKWNAWERNMDMHSGKIQCDKTQGSETNAETDYQNTDFYSGVVWERKSHVNGNSYYKI